MRYYASLKCQAITALGIGCFLGKTGFKSGKSIFSNLGWVAKCVMALWSESIGQTQLLPVIFDKKNSRDKKQITRSLQPQVLLEGDVVKV